MERVTFDARKRIEVSWDITTDDGTFVLSHQEMEEVVARWLRDVQLKVVDMNNNPVELKGLYH